MGIKTSINSHTLAVRSLQVVLLLAHAVKYFRIFFLLASPSLSVGYCDFIKTVVAAPILIVKLIF